MELEPLSDLLLRENDDVFRSMLNHRFVADIKNDALGMEVFRRYLVFEGSFVDTAISIFAFAIANAPSIAQKRWLIGVLESLANEQVRYFERSYELAGIAIEDIEQKSPSVEAFKSGMLEIARVGGYVDTIVAMFAAEWMYWTWCKDAVGFPITDPLIKEWVLLHVTEDFAAGAKWLKLEVDSAGKLLEGSDRARLVEIFRRAMAMEIEFHSAAYI